jgi:hypothetical protein
MITCGQSNLTNIDKATPTNFQLIFPKLPTEESINANNPFTLNIFSAVIPSLSLAEEERRWQGNKSKDALIPLEFDSWLVSYIVDSRLENWLLLYNWMSYINNNRDKIAELRQAYSVDANLIVTDNYRNPVLSITFVDIWPSVMGEVSFSSREGDIQLESTVNFTFDHFIIRE